VLTENREDFKTLTHELVAAVHDLRTLAQVSKSQLEPGGKANALLDDAAATAHWARKDLPEISNDAKTLLRHVNGLSAQLTEDDVKSAKRMLAEYKSAGEKLNALADRSERLLQKLESGDGTLGALLKDKQAYDDLKSLLADLRKHPWKMLWKD
jgi:phospholipid/cholesterol/gamma-HCH transport system substrate-binding protein